MHVRTVVEVRAAWLGAVNARNNAQLLHNRTMEIEATIVADALAWVMGDADRLPGGIKLLWENGTLTETVGGGEAAAASASSSPSGSPSEGRPCR